jgi:hypothetical protein
MFAERLHRHHHGLIHFVTDDATDLLLAPADHGRRCNGLCRLIYHLVGPPQLVFAQQRLDPRNLTAQ